MKIIDIALAVAIVLALIVLPNQLDRMGVVIFGIDKVDCARPLAVGEVRVETVVADHEPRRVCKQ